MSAMEKRIEAVVDTILEDYSGNREIDQMADESRRKQTYMAKLEQRKPKPRAMELSSS